MKRIRVEVTKEDIDKGTRHSCSTCPVARALERALECDMAFVGRDIFHYEKEGKTSKILSLPAFVSLKIQLFDSTGEMEPFGFDLEILERN